MHNDIACTKDFICNNVGDKLLFNFSMKFLPQFISSHVKWQFCRDNLVCSAKMASRFEDFTNYEHNLSLMILKGDQMVLYTRELRE